MRNMEFCLTTLCTGEPVAVLQYITVHLWLDVASAVTKAVFIGLLNL